MLHRDCQLLSYCSAVDHETEGGLTSGILPFWACVVHWLIWASPTQNSGWSFPYSMIQFPLLLFLCNWHLLPQHGPGGSLIHENIPVPYCMTLHPRDQNLKYYITELKFVPPRKSVLCVYCICIIRLICNNTCILFRGWPKFICILHTQYTSHSPLNCIKLCITFFTSTYIWIYMSDPLCEGHFDKHNTWRVGCIPLFRWPGCHIDRFVIAAIWPVTITFYVSDILWAMDSAQSNIHVMSRPLPWTFMVSRYQ